MFGDRTSVYKQMDYEILMRRHAGSSNECIGAGVYTAFAGLLSIAPVNMKNEDGIFVGMFLLMSAFAIYLYTHTLTVIKESGENVSVFDKYINIPVNKKVLISGKLALLLRFSIRLLVVCQGLNCVATAIARYSYLCIWAYYPSIIIILLTLMESLVIVFMAREL